MIRTGVQNKIAVKSLKSSRRLGGAAAPPMMFEEVMIQIGVQ